MSRGAGASARFQMMTKILLAGGTGCLGRAVHRELLARGHRPGAKTGAARAGEHGLAGGSSAGGFAARLLRWNRGSVSCAGAAMTLHNWRDRPGFREVDQEGNHNLLAEAKRAGVGNAFMFRWQAPRA